jgi:alpha-D-ribose 1-methylphosphonate 5-triphosphate diphosphatase PhnM
MALASERLIDIIATDYAAGHWDGVFEPVEDIVRQGLASLEQAVAMTSGNVGKAMPRIGADRGLIRSGYLADLVVADAAHPADIDMVLIDGAVQLDNSGLLAATR